MTGKKCQSYVQHYAGSDVDVVIVPENEKDNKEYKGFSPDRVRIYVNDEGYVIAIPDRG